MKLKGKTALVTGAGGGIGRAICLRLAAEGARVAVTDLSLERASAVAAEIQAAGGDASGHALDVTRSEEVRKAFHDIVANPSNPDHKRYHSDPAFAAEIDARRSKGIELGV